MMCTSLFLPWMTWATAVLSLTPLMFEPVIAPTPSAVPVLAPSEIRMQLRMKGYRFESESVQRDGLRLIASEVIIRSDAIPEWVTYAKTVECQLGSDEVALSEPAFTWVELGDPMPALPNSTDGERTKPSSHSQWVRAKRAILDRGGDKVSVEGAYYRGVRVEAMVVWPEELRAHLRGITATIGRDKGSVMNNAGRFAAITAAEGEVRWDRKKNQVFAKLARIRSKQPSNVGPASGKNFDTIEAKLAEAEYSVKEESGRATLREVRSEIAGLTVRSDLLILEHKPKK